MENDFTKNLKNILKNKRIRKFPGKIAMATSLAVILSANAFAGGITAEAAEFDYQEEDFASDLAHQEGDFAAGLVGQEGASSNVQSSYSSIYGEDEIESFSDNWSGKVLLDDYLNLEEGAIEDALNANLTSFVQNNNSYQGSDATPFLGTPYNGEVDRGPGQGMNCISFVLRVLQETGMDNLYDLDMDSTTSLYSFLNWVGGKDRGSYKILAYEYSNTEMLLQGYPDLSEKNAGQVIENYKPMKGDILVAIPKGSIGGRNDHHIGFYMGDTDGENPDALSGNLNLFWHSIERLRDGNPLLGGVNSNKANATGNMISSIQGVAEDVTWIVFPVSHRKYYAGIQVQNQEGDELEGVTFTYQVAYQNIETGKISYEDMGKVTTDANGLAMAVFTSKAVKGMIPDFSKDVRFIKTVEDSSELYYEVDCQDSESQAQKSADQITIEESIQGQLISNNGTVKSILEGFTNKKTTSGQYFNIFNSIKEDSDE